MKKKHLKEIKKIKDLMVNSLEQRMTMTVSGSDKKTTYLSGEFVCYDEGYGNSDSIDADFVVCGQEADVAYLVMIQKIDL